MNSRHYDPAIHHRRSIRLPAFDYTQPGAYFVTICSQERACRFRVIREGEMFPNPAGEMLTVWWLELANKYPLVCPGDLTVMPNHLHGIFYFQERSESIDPSVRLGATSKFPDDASLSTVMQWYKTMTTNAYIKGVKANGWSPFLGQLWQRNYYEHIVRGEADLMHIREYIIHNPALWTEDDEFLPP